MQRIKAVLGAAALAASAVALPAASAQAAAATHTIHLIDHPSKVGVTWRQEPAFAFADIVTDAATGQRVGLIMLDCGVAPKLATADCDATLALRGGELRGMVHSDFKINTPTYGTISGGTRDFRNVTVGTIKAVDHPSYTEVWITYH